MKCFWCNKLGHWAAYGFLAKGKIVLLKYGKKPQPEDEMYHDALIIYLDPDTIGEPLWVRVELSSREEGDVNKSAYLYIWVLKVGNPFFVSF